MSDHFKGWVCSYCGNNNLKNKKRCDVCGQHRPLPDLLPYFMRVCDVLFIVCVSVGFLATLIAVIFKLKDGAMTDILQNGITFGKTVYQNAKNIVTVCVWSHGKELLRQTADNADVTYGNAQLLLKRCVRFLAEWKDTAPTAVFNTVNQNMSYLRDGAVALWQAAKENASAIPSAFRMIWKTVKESVGELRQMFAA